MGAFFTSSGSRVVPITGAATSNEIVEACTSTVSLVAPTSNTTLTVVILATSTTISSWAFLKLGESTVTVYRPGIRPTTRKVPSVEVMDEDATFVAVLVAVTRALGITAPLVSATVPLRPVTD